MSVWTGPCYDLQCVSGNDDSCGSGSRVSWASVLGHIYYIFICKLIDCFVLLSSPCALDRTYGLSHLQTVLLVPQGTLF
jgi:hypothetical protein